MAKSHIFKGCRLYNSIVQGDCIGSGLNMHNKDVVAGGKDEAKPAAPLSLSARIASLQASQARAGKCVRVCVCVLVCMCVWCACACVCMHNINIGPDVPMLLTSSTIFIHLANSRNVAYY